MQWGRNYLLKLNDFIKVKKNNLEPKINNMTQTLYKTDFLIYAYVKKQILKIRDCTSYASTVKIISILPFKVSL